MSAAQTGRTHDLHPTASRKPKESLDPWAPSTHDPLGQRHDVAGSSTLKSEAFGLTLDPFALHLGTLPGAWGHALHITQRPEDVHIV